MTKAQKHHSIVVVRTKIPREDIGGRFCPSGNVLGLLMLFRVIAKELERQGLLGDISTWGGKLEDGALAYLVKDRAKALKAIESELKLCLVLEVSQVGWFATDELIWRQHYPASSGNVMPNFEFEDLSRLLEATHRHLWPWWTKIFKKA
jgi:hypothetical protein